MASTADFRNGMVMEIDGDLWAITYFQHVKPGKGGAFVRSKLKNIRSGKVVDKPAEPVAAVSGDSDDKEEAQPEE